MPVYTIQDTVTQLSTTYSQPYQIRNAGENTIFLGKDTSVSPSYYDWSLSPGDTLGFGAETYLYCVCDTGKESTLEQQYGALGNFTPGPSNVLARLASDLTFLDATTFPVPAAAVVNGGMSGYVDVDVSDYASVLFTVETLATPPGGFVANISDYVQGSVFMVGDSVLGTSGGSLLQPQWLLAHPPNFPGTTQRLLQSLQAPVTGRVARYHFILNKAITPTGGNVTVRVYGSNEAIATPRYRSVGSGLLGGYDVQDYYALNIPVNSSRTQLVASTNGPAVFSLYKFSAGTGTMAARLYVARSGVQKNYVRSVEAGVGIGSDVYNIALPMLPIILNGSTVSGATGDVVLVKG